MTTPTEGPKKEDVVTPEEEQSMATMTRERVIKRLREKQSETAKKAKELLDQSKSYSAGLDMVEGLDKKVREDETTTLGKELGEGKEQTELLAHLAWQYPQMVQTLKIYETPLEGMPSWERVQKGLTPEVLEKALKLEEPTLILVAPNSRQDKVKAIDSHKIDSHKINSQIYDTDIYELGNNDLWNGGKEEKEKQWRVSIVEGVQDVEADPDIDPEKMNNYKMAKAWVKKYKTKGLDVMNDADAYLTLMMASLLKGAPVDQDFYTVLNVRNVRPHSRLAVGGFTNGRVHLSDAIPNYRYAHLRLRGSVGVVLH